MRRSLFSLSRLASGKWTERSPNTWVAHERRIRLALLDECSYSGQQEPGNIPSSSSLPRLERRLQQWRGFATKAEEYNVISVEIGLIVIEGYDETGFIVNGAYVEGAIMCSGQLLTLWRPKTLEDVTKDSLSLLLAAKPAPDLLVLGCGPKIGDVPREISDWLAARGIALEILDTGNAVSTYNILSQEGRTVVAALLPSG